MSWVFLSSKDRVVARKKHVCFYCNEDIQIGSIYGTRTGVSYGDLNCMKYHPECDDAAKHWTQEDYECFCPGDMKRPQPAAAAKPKGDA